MLNYLGKVSNMTEENIISLPSQQASYFDLFMRLLDAVFLLDRETYAILEANDSCERLLGKKPDELIGMSFLDFIEPEALDDSNKKLRIAKRKYYPLEFEAKFRPIAEKELFTRISACSLKLSNESEVLQVIAKNITQEKESQRVLDAYMAELKTLNEKLQLLSTTDELTQLNNIRRFKQRLQEEDERSRRYPNIYSVILFDVDNFKHYNDSHGHPAGDELLRTLGKILKEKTRATDFPARYGGEEFIILCPEVGCEDAINIAERYRKMIEAYPFNFAAEQPLGKVSVSIGVASWPEAGATPLDIVKAADQALYYSKKHGRNQTTSFKQIPKDHVEESTG
jgi:diguanylate cyclase (GGDEF)-like protein/PAS domain S-box-containing protein